MTCFDRPGPPEMTEKRAQDILLGLTKREALLKYFDDLRAMILLADEEKIHYSVHRESGGWAHNTQWTQWTIELGVRQPFPPREPDSW